MNARFGEIVDVVKSLYPDMDPVQLHRPRFLGNEKRYLEDCIDSTYVSYVGKYVGEFENHVTRLTGARRAIAMVNGTAALQMAFVASGIGPGDVVITQALTFAATMAAIRHAGAGVAFVDVDRDTMGMSPTSLAAFLKDTTQHEGNGRCRFTRTGERVAAVVPMHTLGFPVHVDEILDVCASYGLPVIEDAAESLGSRYHGKHTGRFGRAGIFSFNGNKPVTTGGGGMLITDDDELAARALHLSTTAKVKHPWEFFHDEVGFNYRMPNVNAAIGCAQMEYFDRILANKRETAELYRRRLSPLGIPVVAECEGCMANYWLNTLVLSGRDERDRFLTYAAERGVQARPLWTLGHKLPPYANCPRAELLNAQWLENRVVNVPSGMRVAQA